MALTLKIFTRAEGAARFMGQHELQGGRVTIGRSVECTLQLPDPEKKLSRVHLELAQTAGGYRLRVASAHSSVAVNGREYPPGSEVTLRAGDALAMDVYDLDIVSVGTAVPEQVALARVPAAQVPIAESTAHPAALVRPPGARASLAKRLGIAAAAIAGVMFVLAFWPHSTGRIEDMAYRVKPGGRVDFKGVHKGERFVLVRTRAKDGEGAWDYFVGPPTDRIRATATDKKGLGEILALDTGFRMTLGFAEGKRLEYRLYGPDRGFLSGSVLYRDKGRWLHGMLKTEAFAGYGELVGVTDITEKVERRKVSSHTGTRDLVFSLATGLISSAKAADTESEDTHGFHDLTTKDIKEVNRDARIEGAKAFKEGQKDVEEREEIASAASGALTGGMGERARYLLDGATEKIEEKRNELKKRFLAKAVDVVADYSTVVKDARDAYKFGTGGDVDVDDAPQAGSGGGDWLSLGGGSGGYLENKLNGLLNVATHYVNKAKRFAGIGAEPTDTYDVAESPSSPKGPPDLYDTSANRHFIAFTRATDEAGRCIRANDFACAESAIEDLKKHARHGDVIEQWRDEETIKAITQSADTARKEISETALRKDEAARQALAAQDRQTANAAAAAAADLAQQEAARRANTPPPRPIRPRPELAQDNSVLEAEERRRLEAEFRHTMLDKQSVQEANEETQRSRQARLPFGMEGGFNVAQELARLSGEERRANARLEATTGRLEQSARATAAAPSGNCGGYDPLLGSVGKSGDIQCTVQLQNAEGLRQQAIQNCKLGDKKSADIIYKDRYKKIIDFVKSQCPASGASTSVPTQDRAPTLNPLATQNFPQVSQGQSIPRSAGASSTGGNLQPLKEAKPSVPPPSSAPRPLTAFEKCMKFQQDNASNRKFCTDRVARLNLK